MIGLAAMLYKPLYHAREIETIKLSSGCSWKAKSVRSNNISWLFLIEKLFHSHLLDMRRLCPSLRYLSSHIDIPYCHIECKYMKHIFWTSDERSNRRKILAVRTQLKQLRKESLKKFNWDQLPVGLIAKLVEHYTGRGHGFESRSSLNFFQAFFSLLLKLRPNCEDLSSILYCHIVGHLSSHIQRTLVKTVFFFAYSDWLLKRDRIQIFIGNVPTGKTGLSLSIKFEIR